MYKVIYEQKHWYGWRECDRVNRGYFMPTLESACKLANSLNDTMSSYAIGKYRYNIKKVNL